MSRIVAIGEGALVGGFAFAGVHVEAADEPERARAAWHALPEDVALVILTATARAALEADLLARLDERLWVVMPG
jgi:vacuolar-type H+-ATPase subunit F/Vma7